MARPKVEEGKKCIRKDISMEPDQYRRLCEYCQKTERPLSWVSAGAGRISEKCCVTLCINTQVN
ncbi:MAG: hypothetical protein ACLVLH_04215 [Eisenbergiella massiliensis]